MCPGCSVSGQLGDSAVQAEVAFVLLPGQTLDFVVLLLNGAVEALNLIPQQL